MVLFPILDYLALIHGVLSVKTSSRAFEVILRGILLDLEFGTKPVVIPYLFQVFHLISPDKVYHKARYQRFRCVLLSIATHVLLALMILLIISGICRFAISIFFYAEASLFCCSVADLIKQTIKGMTSIFLFIGQFA